MDTGGVLNGAQLDDAASANLDTAILEYITPTFSQNITEFVRGFSTQRGAQRELQRVEAGTASLTLDNRDGRFTPFKPGPYYPNILPMRRVRIMASWIASPSSVAGLLGWWAFEEAATLWQDTARTSPITADGQTIKGVTDKSGNGNHLSEATNGPAYKVNIINGKSVGRFDGTNDTLTCAALSSTLTQPYTVFLAMRYLDISTVNDPSMDGPTGGRSHPVLCNNGINGNWGSFYGSAVIPSSVADDTTTHVFCATANGAASALRIDGGANTIAGNPGTDSLSSLTLANNTGVFANIEYLDLLLYSGNLSNADKDTVGQYLAASAGTTWTAVS